MQRLLSKFAELYNHQHSPVLEYFHCPNKIPQARLQLIPIPNPQPQARVAACYETSWVVTGIAVGETHTVSRIKGSGHQREPSHHLGRSWLRLFSTYQPSSYHWFVTYPAESDSSCSATSSPAGRWVLQLQEAKSTNNTSDKTVSLMWECDPWILGLVLQ